MGPIIKLKRISILFYLLCYFTFSAESIIIELGLFYYFMLRTVQFMQGTHESMRNCFLYREHTVMQKVYIVTCAESAHQSARLSSHQSVRL